MRRENERLNLVLAPPSFPPCRTVEVICYSTFTSMHSHLNISLTDARIDVESLSPGTLDPYQSSWSKQK